SWSDGTPVPIAAYGWSGGIIGNKIVVVGGYAPTSGMLESTFIGTIDPSDPTNITWVIGDNYPAGTVFRETASASLDEASGLVIFTAGDPNGLGTSALSNTFAYDVNSDTWKLGPDKITAANNLRNMTCVAANDSLYIVSVGGYDGANELDVNE